MRFKSALVTTVGGSIGGMTGSRNRAGLYLRARAIPVNPNTGFQVTIRAIFGNLSARWGTLTDAQRDAWTTYAINVTTQDRFGDAQTLTGHAMYVRNNTARVQAGLDPVDDGPVVFSMDSLSPIGFQSSAAADELSIDFVEADDWVGEDDAGLLIYGSRQVAPTINYFKGPYRFTAFIAGNLALPPTTPSVEDSLFALDVGNASFCRFQSVRADGRVSPIQRVGPVIIGI